MRILLSSFTFFASMLILAMSCTKETPPYKYQSKLNLPASADNYTRPELGSTSRNQAVQQRLAEKGVTDQGATLGRVLFYDPILSRTNTVSCASCHHQSAGFADVNQFSKGFDGELTSRNASSIANLYNYEAFFWDGRETDLNRMAVAPISNHIEMGLDQPDVLVRKLRAAEYYEPLFTKAFGTSGITEAKIGHALAQFLHSIITEKAPTDQLNGGGWSQPSNVATVFPDSKVQLGAELFFENDCGSCHVRSFRNDFMNNEMSIFANIGLDIISADPGLLLNGQATHLFKVPDLHNVALTAPYMHDGRFKTLREVVDHYSDNIQASPQLSWELNNPVNGSPKRLNLSDTQKEALVAFLEQFTDSSLANDPKFSNPFE
jgi:cytochrome c peroxidase